MSDKEMGIEFNKNAKFSPADTLLLIAGLRLHNDPLNKDLQHEFDEVVQLTRELPFESNEREATIQLSEIYHTYVRGNYLLPFRGEISERNLSIEDFGALFVQNNED